MRRVLAPRSCVNVATQETQEWFTEQRASPVVVGAFFYDVWYGRTLVPSVMALRKQVALSLQRGTIANGPNLVR